MPDEKIIDKIHKLLAKAERTDNPDEAEVFSAKAAELMAKHTIDSSVLRKNADENGITVFKIDISGAYYIGLRDFAVAVGDALGFKPLLFNYGKVKEVGWYGFADDLANAEVIWASLRLQCERFSRIHMESFVPPDPLDDRSDRFYEKRSFMVGFGLRAAARLHAARASAVTHATEEYGHSAALVLADRGQQVEKWIQEHLNVGKARTSKNKHTMSGLEGGRAAADRADLGQRAVR